MENHLEQKALPMPDRWWEIDCQADGKSQTACNTGGDYREAEKNQNVTLVAEISCFI